MLENLTEINNKDLYVSINELKGILNKCYINEWRKDLDKSL